MSSLWPYPPPIYPYFLANTVSPLSLVFPKSYFFSSVHFSNPELLVDKSDRHFRSYLTLLPPLGPFLGLLAWHLLFFLTLIVCALSLLFFPHMFSRENPIYFMTLNTASVLYAEDFQINISSPNLSSALNSCVSNCELVILLNVSLNMSKHVFS